MDLQVKKLFYISGPFALLGSVAYLIGFWRSFGIDVFHYIGVSDIVVLALVPLVVTILLVAAGACIGAIVYPRIEGLEGGQRPTRRQLILHFAEVAALLLVLYFAARPSWKDIGYLIVVVLLYAFTATSTVLRSEFQSRVVRSIIIFVLVATPILMFAFARRQAAMIRAGNGEWVVRSSELQCLQATSKPDELLPYIGKAGPFLFLLDSDGESVIVASAAECGVLRLRSRVRETDEPSD